MALIAVVLFGWCLLSLPIGILVGRLLRRSPEAKPAGRRPAMTDVTPRPVSV
ncbi:hypothetical protein NOCARDAX2BIS_80031 [Nocardioides sp. AX2bis]|nr:hypothetical protein NOCARDAX2BIS_80031 [Nocardioides sp. AX2bis]